MLTNGSAVYLDSSALVKLVISEQESSQIDDYLAQRPRWVSCALARVEVVRAVQAHGHDAVLQAREIFDHMYLVEIDDTLLDDAATLEPPTLRSLDAIHLAAARTLGQDVGAFVTYDARLAAAATQLGLRVEAPGR